MPALISRVGARVKKKKKKKKNSLICRALYLWGLSAQLENDTQGKGLPAYDFRSLNSEDFNTSVTISGSDKLLY